MATSSYSPTKAAAKKVDAKADAIALLKADHKIVDGLFKDYEKAEDGAEKSEIAGKICEELTIHATIEEKIFYPEGYDASEDDEENQDMLNEAEVEHSGIKRLVGEIEAALEKGDPDDMTDAKVKVLSEYVKHHVKEEEEELFPELKKTDMDMKEIGARLQAMKEKLKANAS